MKTSSIFFSWFLTVTIGSLAVSILYPIVKGSSFHMLEFIITYTISWLLSAIFLTPTLLVLMIVHNQYENEGENPARQYQMLNRIHLFLFLLTALVGDVFYLYPTIKLQSIWNYTALVILYGFVSMIIWLIRFRSVRKQIKANKQLSNH